MTSLLSVRAANPAPTYASPAAAQPEKSERPDVVSLHQTNSRNFLPWPAYYVIIKGEQEDILLGEPAALAGDRHGLATQRLSPVATVMSSLASLAVPEVAIPLLLAGVVFGVGYGTRKSLVLARRAEIQHQSLKREATELEANEQELLQCSTASDVQRTGQLETNEAVEFMNVAGENRAWLGMTFTGVVPAVGATVAAVGLLTRPVLLGSLSPALAAASPILSYVGAPILATGAAASGAYDVYAYSVLHKIAQGIETMELTPIMGNEAAVQQLLVDRLHMQSSEALYSAVASFGVAAGIPATVFGGPWGMGILVPSIIGTLVISYVRANRTAYEHKLENADKLALDSNHALMNRVDRERQQYYLLKELKNRKRLHYPFAENSPVGFAVRAINAVRIRTQAEAYDNEPSPVATIYELLRGRHCIHTTFHENQKKLAMAELAATNAELDPTRVAELEKRCHEADVQIAALAKDDAWVENEFSGTLTAEVVAFHLARILVMNNVMGPFALRLVNDAEVRPALEAAGVLRITPPDCEVDANALVLALCEDSEIPACERFRLTTRIAEHAEHVLLTEFKRDCQSRTRELLDTLAVRLTHPPIPGKGQSSPCPAIHAFCSQQV